ncbi:MAG TPA: ribosome biogenesis GTPase Der [Alphaproteobacteria bacterium]|nr:ribosome biogenesis GTPase Der [Alphaproteobacteria bacterium]
MTFTVVIAGRPNVGKSTLFNRLAGRRLALVDATPGLTRDWREGEASLGPLRFRVIDTAGFEEAEETGLSPRLQRQTARALEKANAVLFLVDGQAGITPLDGHFAEWLRRQGRPIVLVVNKADAKAAEAGLIEAYGLGLGEPIAVSAAHGTGLDALYDALAPLAEGRAQEGPEPRKAEGPALNLAIIGRPNVGKSTLFNALLKEERALTGPEPSLTRDAVVATWRSHGREVRLIDTAGLRRRPKIAEGPEALAVTDALRAIRFAEVVILVLDATQEIGKQDLALAALIEAEGRAPVIVLNKWDLVDHKRARLKAVRQALEAGFAQAKGVALVALSALSRAGLEKLMPQVLRAHALWNRRLRTPALNRWLAAASERHPPPQAPGARIKLRFVTQVNTRPPTFALFLNRPAKLPDSYRRYLVAGLRETLGLPGVPIRLMLRKGENPYARKR